MVGTRSIPPEEWDAQKPAISSLYLKEDKTLDELMKLMESGHGFYASKAQYVRKLRQWHIDKNVTSDKWKFVAIQTQKRKLEGNETEVLIDGKKISPKKLRKEISRYGGLKPWGGGDSATMDIPEGVVIRTPTKESIKSVEFSHLPWFQFQHLIDSYRLRHMGTTVPPFSSGDSVLSNNLPLLNGMNGSSINTVSSHPPSSSGFHQGLLLAPIIEHRDFRIRSMLEGCLYPYLSSNDREYITRASEALELVIVERHGGELRQQLQRLNSSSTLDSTFEVLRYMAYLSSNDLLDYLGRGVVLKWAFQNTFWIIEHMVEAKMPTVDIFASCILLNSIKLEEVDIVNILLAKGVDPNNYPSNEIPLAKAVESGNLSLVRLLLEAGADPNARRKAKFEDMPLQIALRDNKSTSIIETLISYGADVNLPAFIKYLPNVFDGGLRTHNIKHMTLLGVAIEKNTLRCIEHVQILLKAGARVNEASELSGTPLQLAALRNNVELVDLLVKAGADVNSPNGDTYEDACKAALEGRFYDFLSTPLQLAAAQGNTEMAQILLDGGANVNGCPAMKYGRLSNLSRDEINEYQYDYFADTHEKADLLTALHLAVQDRNIILVRILLSHGANIDAVGVMGTALQIAARQPGGLKLVRLLLGKGADVNSPAQVARSFTALQAGALSGKKKHLVECLLSAGADVNASPNPQDGLTAVQAAAKSGKLDLVKLLVNAGADVNAPASPISGRTCIQAAAENGDLELVDFLLESGANINGPASIEKGGRTALQAAVEKDHTVVILRLLENNADVNGRPSLQDGTTALYAALRNRRYQLAWLLISKGADPNHSLDDWLNSYAYDHSIRDDLYCQPVTSPTAKAVKTLVNAGADIHHVLRGLSSRSVVITEDIFRIFMDAMVEVDNISGALLLELAVYNKRTDIVSPLLKKGASPNPPPGWLKMSILASAIQLKSGHDVVRALLDYGADVNADQGLALRKAIKNKDTRTVKMLLEAGADVNDRPDQSPTALQEAVDKEHSDIVEILLSAGADINAPPCSRGYTALQAAVYSGSLEMVKLLLSRGADVNGPPGGPRGETALQTAAREGYLGIVLMLLKEGADINAAPSTEDGQTALELAAENGRLDIAYLLLQNDSDEENIEKRCQRAAKVASSAGQSILARSLREWKKS